MTSSEIYASMIQPRGRAYRDHQVASWSNYRNPIDHSPGRVAGNSHIWGDATPETQSRAIDALISSSERAGLNPREIAYVLATARVESGFNPDAAAGTTSAYGLGQFIEATAEAYGMNELNHGKLRLQADALVAHYQDNAALARSRGHDEEYIYKYHHDGPSKDSGGLKIARKEVMSYLDRYEQFVQAHQQKYGVEPLGPSTVRRPGSHAHDPAVDELQSGLKALGYTGAHGRALEVDGNLGANTRHAVKAFQHDHGLTANGVAGPETLKKLSNLSHSQVAAKPATLLTDPTHPDHALFKQALVGVHRMDARTDRTTDQFSDNLAACLAVAARRDGMSHIDHVTPSTDAARVFAVQGALNSSFKQITSVPTVESLNTPVEQSSAAWQQQALQQKVLEQQSQQRVQHPAPRDAGSAMAI